MFKKEICIVICLILSLGSICLANSDMRLSNLPDLEEQNKSYCYITDGKGIGSGSVIEVNGEIYILTCWHVIESHYCALVQKQESKLYTVFCDRSLIEVKVAKIDPLHDLALLKPAEGLDFPVCVLAIPINNFAESDKIKFGSKIYKIGSPAGIFDVPAEGTVGIAMILNMDNSPQMEVRMININSWAGDSGCATFDDEGKFTGMIFIGTKLGIVGIIPSNTVKRGVKWMLEKTQGGRSGLVLLDDYEGNVVVLRSGNSLFRPGDIIVQVETMHIKDAMAERQIYSSQLFEAVASSFNKGDVIIAEIQRNGQDFKIKLVIQ